MTMLGKWQKKLFVRHYTEDDVEKAWYLQNKFENVNTIAKDSCFHFHYLGEKKKEIMTTILLKEKNNRKTF